MSILPLVVSLLVAVPPSTDDAYLTVAESSGYRATATHAQVMELLERLDTESDVMHLTEAGRTVEGRAIPLAVLADPPLTTPEEARERGVPVVFAFGDIHAGEVCGKEALLMLARELALTPDHPMLRDLVVLIMPILNGDGNDRMAPDNRRGQVGPVDGMGERPNAQGLDLNRDWVKLESPEIRAVVRLLNEWAPHLTIDTHTTNGSRHRYTLTYAAPLNPSGYRPSIEFIRDGLLPRVSKRLREETPYDTFFYGNFNRDQTVFSTYSADPRFGGPYRGLRGQMSVLSEAYSYATYRDRVLATRAFVRAIFDDVIEHADRVITLREEARRETTTAGRNPQPGDVVGLRHRPAAFNQPAVVRGFVMTPGPNGRPEATNEPKDYTVVFRGRFEPTVSVRRPYAYLFDGEKLAHVREKLEQHGIVVTPLVADAGASVEIEVYGVRAVTRAEREFQGHRLVTLDVEARPDRRSFPAGRTVMVETAQPLGTLAVYLLEPHSTDGLAAWNFFDDHVEVDGEFPVYRVPYSSSLR